MANPIGFKVPLYKGTSIRVEEWNDSNFYDVIHFHEEFQLTLIIGGSGILTVGTDANDFNPGEFYLFGKNLPHAFRRSKRSNNRKNAKAHHISIFFNEHSFNSLLKQNPETHEIRVLLKKALLGLKFYNIDAKYLLSKIKTLAIMSDFDKVLGLLEILNVLSKDKCHSVLLKVQIQKSNYDFSGIDKINEVFNFINSNYKTKISLQNIATRFNMSSATFARFFKLRTKKTFSQYLIEIRIKRACELIRNGTHNITESCYDSGFTNISNFQRQFKNVLQMTPTQYKDKIT